MSEEEIQEQKMLEERLDKALEEAWTKTNHALEQTKDHAEGFAKKIWLAAEAAEFSSLLYSLAFSLEDVDPAPPTTRGLDPLSLVKESASALQELRSASRREHAEGYSLLRSAVYYLRTAYAASLKEAKRARQL